MNKVAVRTLWLACAVATGARGADGDLDASFGVGGVVLDPTAFANYPGFAMQSDGRLILCDTRIASTSGYDFYVARFDANGAPDATFGEGGAVLIAFGSGIDDFDDSCDAVAVQADGKIVLAGTRVTPGFPLPTFAEFAVARIEADGAPDTTFGAGTGTTHFAFAGFDQGGGAHTIKHPAVNEINTEFNRPINAYIRDQLASLRDELREANRLAQIKIDEFWQQNPSAGT